jgi:AraC-like DNA-binding protein
MPYRIILYGGAKMSERLKKWSGSAAIVHGLGVSVGHSGHNVEHRHWAHQISIALEDEVIISSDKRTIKGSAIFIPANIAHALHLSLTLTIYLDPNSALAKSIVSNIVNLDSIYQLDSEIKNQITDCFKNIDKLESGSQALQQSFMKSITNNSDDRLSKFLSRLDDIYSGDTVNRDELAAHVSLSPSRFSHWFKEETGMPLRSYKKWLHLVHGIELILTNKNIQSAAYGSNFADQAHFSRTFKQAFGLSPALALSNINRT